MTVRPGGEERLVNGHKITVRTTRSHCCIAQGGGAG